MKAKALKSMILAMGLLLCSCNAQTVRSIVRTYVDESGYLIVVYNDGTEENAGYVKGEDGKDGSDGKDGANGQDGKDGIDGKDGKDGRDGADGIDGKDGADGKDGQDGHTPYIGQNGNWWIDGEDTGVPATGPAGEDGETVYVPTLDVNLITYDADIMTVGKTYQYMAVDNQIYSGGHCYPMPRSENMTTAERESQTAADLSTTSRLSCWPRGTTHEEVMVNSAIVPSLYSGKLSNFVPTSWDNVDYGNCYRSYLLVNATVTKVIQSIHSKGGVPYYQCIVYYDYALSI